MIGFNRRFSPHTIKMKSLLDEVNEPKSFIMTMNAGFIAKDHWVNDINIGGGRIIGEACHYIDLMRFLADSKIVNISANKIQKSQTGITEDKASITINFNNGSFGTIHYFSNGSKDFPKERIEVFVDGKVLQNDNFKILRGYGWNNFKSMKTWSQNKGQKNCVNAFLQSLKSGIPAIPIEDIFEVSSKSIDAANMLK
jgi:predicted dehydrogenase